MPDSPAGSDYILNSTGGPFMRGLTHSLVGLGVALAMASGDAYAAEGNKTMELKSKAFAQLADIPSQYTCEGSDQSPPLAWSGVPAGTKSLALIVDDPDAPDPAAPRMTWVHWVLYNLPPDSTGIEAGKSRASDLPAGTRQGLNDWKREGYGGPCPPIGRHRYFHKLYALDIVLPVLQPATKAALEKAMQGHILAVGELVGYYKKKK
jgi:Raf kinase inhibitor-like YbhB/YbcL family protein